MGDTPEGQPLSLEASSPSSSSILLMWKDPPKRNWNGKLLGYRAGWREIRYLKTIQQNKLSIYNN